MSEPLLYKIGRPIVKTLFDLVYKPNYIGVENIPRDGRLVIASNHTNDLDCFLVMSSTKRVIHFMGKHTLFKGCWKYFFRGMGVIPVNRTIKDKNCLNEAREVLKSDKVIGIFPEGTTNETDEPLLPLKMGAIKLAFDTDSYIIPAVITGNFKRGKTTIKYGVPYMLQGNDLDYELEKLKRIFIDLLEEDA